MYHTFSSCCDLSGFGKKVFIQIDRSICNSWLSFSNKAFLLLLQTVAYSVVLYLDEKKWLLVQHKEKRRGHKKAPIKRASSTMVFGQWPWETQTIGGFGINKTTLTIHISSWGYFNIKAYCPVHNQRKFSRNQSDFFWVSKLQWYCDSLALSLGDSDFGC